MAANPGGTAMAGNSEHGGERRMNGWRIAAWTFAGLILLLPLVAMQFTKDVNWTAGDFVFAGALVLGTGLALELAMRKTADPAYRAAAGIALAAGFLIVWLTGAVGIIGDESNDANWLYAGVLAIGAIGAVLARFQPQGMARTSLAMALATAAIGAIALAARWGSTGPIWPMDVLGLTALLVTLFVGSAMLFQKAARRPSHASTSPAL